MVLSLNPEMEKFCFIENYIPCLTELYDLYMAICLKTLLHISQNYVTHL